MSRKALNINDPKAIEKFLTYLKSLSYQNDETKELIKKYENLLPKEFIEVKE